MAGRIRPAVADPATAAATCMNCAGMVPARGCSRAVGLSCLRPRIRYRPGPYRVVRAQPLAPKVNKAAAQPRAGCSHLGS